MKKKVLIVGVIVIVTFVFLGYYSNKTNESMDKVPITSGNIYLFKNTEQDGVNNVSVLLDGRMLELGNTDHNFIVSIPNYKEYLIAEKDLKKDGFVKLILINRDETKREIGIIDEKYLCELKILDGNIYYKDENSIVKIDPKTSDKSLAKTVINKDDDNYNSLNENLDKIKYTYTRINLGTDNKSEKLFVLGDKEYFRNGNKLIEKVGNNTEDININLKDYSFIEVS